MTFRFNNIPDALSYLRVISKPIVLPDLTSKPRKLPRPQKKRRELIAGGDPVRDAVNKLTSMVVAPAAWWAKPLAATKSTLPEKQKTKKRKIKMQKEYTQIGKGSPDLKVTRINGVDHISYDDLYQAVMKMVIDLPKEATPIVKQARESREIIDQLLHGIGGEMERFQKDAGVHIQNIRSTRYTIVSEVNTMLNALKDVRQFFMGSDYKEQIDRLRGFVELCERLQKLKQSGFLDAVADTMIKLDRPASG
jgi:hypothetical protein